MIEYGGTVRRNLLMHVYPLKRSGDTWRWNIAQVLRRIEQFDGQRVVSIVRDSECESPEEVKKAFQGTVKDFHIYPNEPSLGETVTFVDMLRRVDNLDPRQITYYCHSKGVRHSEFFQPIRNWTATMQSTMLDYPHLIQDELQSKPVVGTFQKTGGAFSSAGTTWHFAGSFYWFRNVSVFSFDGWDRVPRTYYGTEVWPGIVCPKPDNAACLLLCEDKQFGHLYQQKHWDQTVTPLYRKWQVERSHLRRYSSYNEVLKTLKLTRSRKVLITGPQRSGTTIAAKMLASDLGVPCYYEEAFDTHNFERFTDTIRSKSECVIQAPAMSAYAHLFDFPVVWMRRDLTDILRSQHRVNWTDRFEQLEKDKYFDHSSKPSAVVKTTAWETHQRIALGEKAFDMNYESLRGHKLWIDPEKRKGFTERQTAPGCPYPEASMAKK